MRIPRWTEDALPQPADLVASIEARRPHGLLELDRALLWSAPLARGWNAYLRAVRNEIALDRRLKEMAIVCVAHLTGAEYERHHHEPEFLKEGGNVEQAKALRDPQAAANSPLFTPREQLVLRYAIAMTRDVQVPEGLFRDVEAALDRTALVELTATIAAYNMVARFLVALDITADGESR